VSTHISIAPTLARIGQIFVKVHDLDAAIAFYRDTLACSFFFRRRRPWLSLIVAEFADARRA